LESAAYASICEHLQKPHNAGSRPQARFFNTLIDTGGSMWYFTWILGVLLACAFGIINVMWMESEEMLGKDKD